MLTLHKPDAIFSPRHVPTWLMLAFSAGSVNATAVLACQRYVTHVTGTATKLGLEWKHTELMAEFGAVLICFVLGAMFSGFLINGRAHRGKRPLYALPLLIVAALIASVGAVGDAGLFGPFGQTVDTPADFTLLSMLSFAMGLQNAAVATSTGLLVRTTHLTGPATDLGIHLVELFYSTGEDRLTAKRHGALRAGKISCFILGAVASVPLAAHVEYLAFLMPAFVTLLATTLSFLPARIRGRLPLGARAARSGEGKKGMVQKTALEMPSPGRSEPFEEKGSAEKDEPSAKDASEDAPGSKDAPRDE
jgi:uncharacterized membrane protein YoaK (UPF0700 family)